MRDAYDSAKNWIGRARTKHLPDVVANDARCLAEKRLTDEFLMEVVQLLGTLRTSLYYMTTDLCRRRLLGSVVSAMTTTAASTKRMTSRKGSAACS